jgi:hypothetical protein
MTFIMMAEFIDVLRKIAREDSPAGKRARLLMESEVTAHNAADIKILIDAYERNR